MTETITVVDGQIANFRGAGFGDALESLKRGGTAQRAGWNGKHMWLKLSLPQGVLDQPFIYMRTADGKQVVWSPSQTDVLAEDWAGYLPIEDE